jgi:UDP-N-acetylmuramoyl-tripeptide--D-alanyl-D-alanine ligase
MLELGDCAQAEHYRIGRIAAEKADMVFAYGPNGKRVLNGTLTSGMPESKARAFEDRDALIEALKRAAKPGDVLLFKGSRGMHMEKILEGFLKKE